MLFQNLTWTLFDRLYKNLMITSILHSCTTLLRLSSKLIVYHSELTISLFTIFLKYGVIPKFTVYINFILPNSIWLAILLSRNITSNKSKEPQTEFCNLEEHACFRLHRTSVLIFPLSWNVERMLLCTREFLYCFEHDGWTAVFEIFDSTSPLLAVSPVFFIF